MRPKARLSHIVHTARTACTQIYAAASDGIKVALLRVLAWRPRTVVTPFWWIQSKASPVFPPTIAHPVEYLTCFNFAQTTEKGLHIVPGFCTIFQYFSCTIFQCFGFDCCTIFPGTNGAASVRAALWWGEPDSLVLMGLLMTRTVCINTTTPAIKTSTKQRKTRRSLKRALAKWFLSKVKLWSFPISHGVDLIDFI